MSIPLKTPTLQTKWVPEALYPKIQRPKREADPIFLSSDKIQTPGIFNFGSPKSHTAKRMRTPAPLMQMELS